MQGVCVMQFNALNISAARLSALSGDCRADAVAYRWPFPSICLPGSVHICARKRTYVRPCLYICPLGRGKDEAVEGSRVCFSAVDAL